MNAPRYNLKDLHAACIKWAENPVFKPWHSNIELRETDTKFSLTFDQPDGEWAWIEKVFPPSLKPVSLPFNFFNFANFIGLDVESFRIKETYKTAVERYLGTITHDSMVHDKFTLGAYDEVTYAYLNSMTAITLRRTEWADDDAQWAASYYFLRLDLNPDYQVEP